VVIDLYKRLRDPHLVATLDAFRSATRDVGHIRNIAEHVDEYAIGRGHLDQGVDVEPGEVITLTFQDDDALLTARGRTVSVSAVVEACERLASCLKATTMSPRFFELIFPQGLDFDFMVVEPDGSRRIVVGLNEEQKEFKAALAAAHEQAVPIEMEKGECPTCGLRL
jgi:hypothetical protein